jgi:hypothetical protein
MVSDGGGVVVVGWLDWRVGWLVGGDDGTRTHDPLLAKQVLFQLSYVPKVARGWPGIFPEIYSSNPQQALDEHMLASAEEKGYGSREYRRSGEAGEIL